MLRRSNKRKNQPDKPIENTMSNTMSREEFIQNNEDAKKVYEDIMKLRQSVENLKNTGVDGIPKEVVEARATTPLRETEEIIAAKKAILEQAKRDALAEKEKREELLRKEQEAILRQQKVMEAQKRAALIEAEAERRRKEAEEAERRAKEAARKAALEAMEAERRARQVKQAAAQTAAQSQAGVAGQAFQTGKQYKATPDEIAEFFDEKTAGIHNEANMESAKQALLFAQKQQEQTLEKMSLVTEKHTNILAEEQQQKLIQQKKLIKAEQHEVEAILEDKKEERIESITRDIKDRELRKKKLQEEKLRREEAVRAAKAAKLAKAQATKEEKAARELAAKKEKAEKLLAEREARAAKLLAEREARAAKELAEREERRAREEKRRAERLRKAEERELVKKARRDAEARARLEALRLEAKSQADAELGGGIVNVQGMTINTEIKEVVHFRLRDLFSLKSKKERKAETETEKRKLARERRHRTEEARRLVDIAFKRTKESYDKTSFAKKVSKFMAFCERRKVVLLTVFSIMLVLLVAVAGVFNYYTAYAYSYNGKQLGIVKEKDDVLRITDLVQDALTEDKSVDVIIDAREDIEFKRVPITGEEKIDTSEDVLKRLTYMGDLNVNAYCIFVDGKKIGGVESKAIAEEVFRDLEDMYKSHMDGAEIESIEIVEKWEGKESDISLDRVVSQEEMVALLSSNTEKETLHTVSADETLEDIAATYSMDVKQLLKDNPNVTKKNLKTGDKLVIKQVAPVLTMKITEKVTYDKVIEHEVKEKKSKDIYEGYTEIGQTGADGLNEVTSRITYVNGKPMKEVALKTKVRQEPVTEIILIGTKERPPSVGTGKYIWPMNGGYTFTSGFKWRWGRQHQGIDLACPQGNDVLAADGGIVVSSGWGGGYGYEIVIDHGNGMKTRYAHNSKLLVREGEAVFQGQHIAESGNSGRSTGAHLHFEIIVNGTPRDPMNYLP